MNRALGSDQDRYKIITRLGQGHGGRTLLARLVEPDTAPKLTVIKQIYQPQEPLSELTKRLSLLGHHPQLPALVDSWQSVTGQFLTFEYIDTPAATQTKPPPWLPDKVESWLLSLLAVLEYLHSFRLIHGDIRPVNIRQTNNQPPILIDLRITKRLGKQQTAVDATGGDAAYAAPEQALGIVVYASELFSLGLVAIHLLTGLTPFDLYSVADSRWIWPDLVVAPLSKNLSTVLHRLLERSLESRYSSAHQPLIDLKKSPASSLFDQARSLLPTNSLSPPLQALTQKVLSPSASQTTERELKPAPQIQWAPLYQLTIGVTTALALNENILAMGTNTGTLLMCDLTNSDKVYSLEGRHHRDRITALAFHPQGRILYSASRDGIVKQWDSGKLTHTFSQPGWQPTDIAVAPPYLIISEATGHITLWDLEHRTPCHRITQHQDSISEIATNGERLASISRDRTLRLWSLSEKRLIETWPIRPSKSLALHPSGDYVIVSNNRQVEVWALERSNQPDCLCTGSDKITVLALSPDARLLAVGTDGSRLRVYEGASGKCVSELAQGWGVIAIAFDGRTLVSSSQDETVTIWQRQSTP